MPAVTYTAPVKGDIYLKIDPGIVEVFDSNGVYKSQFFAALGSIPYTDDEAAFAANTNGFYYKSNGIDCHVDIFDGPGNYKSQFGLCPDPTVYSDGPGYLGNSLDEVAVDSLGNVWVASSETLQEFDKNGKFLKVTCTGNNSSSSIPNCPSSGFGGTTMAIDSNNNVYLADSSIISKYDSTGKFTSYFILSSGTGTGQVFEVDGIATDSSSNIYVVDSGNNRVEVFDNNGNYLREFGSVGTGDGQFDASGPSAIAIDAHDNVYVVDSVNFRVEKFDTQGNYLSQFSVAPVPGFEYPLPYELAFVK